MKKTPPLKPFLGFVVVFLLLCAGLKAKAQQQQYNVLFISIDDMNDKVDFLGYPVVQTPNLQRLVSRGVVFTRAYCQYPICNPSRTSLLSGFRPDKTGVVSNSVRPRSVMGPDVKFLPEYFSQYGYYSERYGKIMHGSFENDITTWNYAEPPESIDPEGKNVNGIFSKASSGGSWWVSTKTSPGITGDSAVTAHLVNRLKQPIQIPFFMAFGLHDHNPFSPTLENWNKYGDLQYQELLPIDKNGNTSTLHGNGSDNIAVPQTPVNDRSDVPAVAFPQPSTIKTDGEWKKTVHAYYGDVSQMDERLGLVLDQIDSQHLWETTIIVFWSDHGQHLGEHEGTWLKNTLFEESLHVPFIVCVPGKAHGVCSALVEYVDLYPTLAELCGLPAPSGMEGTSFALLLDNPTLPWKRAAFSEVKRNVITGRSVETGRYHYDSWETAGEELYDHISDPQEYTNLVGNAAYATILDSMRVILAQGWQASLPPTYISQTFYADGDGDGYGNLNDNIISFVPIAGYSTDSTDCNDTDSSVHPNAAEICGNGVDDNCDGVVDNVSVFYVDADADGYGNVTDSISSCEIVVGYAANNTDCNDADSSIHPGAIEICGNEVDDDCDGVIDASQIYYRDADGDTYGNALDSVTDCTLPIGYVTNKTDCNDGNFSVHPGSTEICNGIDDNCNGVIDEGVSQLIYYRDADADGYGNALDSVFACSVPTGYTTNKTDCNDGNFSVHPGAVEICSNGIDDNCDGQIDEKPSATITAMGSLNICTTGSVLLQATTGTGFSYKWKNNNVVIPGQINTTYSVTTPGTYKVVVTTTGGCSKTSSVTTVTNSCGKTTTEEVAPVFSLSPNPTKGLTYLKYGSKKSTSLTITVSDGLKKILYTKKHIVFPGENNIKLELQKLYPGIYFVELFDGYTKIHGTLIRE